MTRDGISNDQPVEPGMCAKCEAHLHVPFGMEPLKYCAACAHARIQQLERELAERDEDWIRALARASVAEHELESIRRMSTTGTARNWLTLPDSDKLLTFALAVEESARRKEARREALEEALAIAANYEDVEDRSDGTQQANLAMTICTELRDLLERK